MGEAKQRGTRDERVALAKEREAERERLWNEKQRERAEQRRQADAIRPKASPKMGRSRLLATAVLALAAAGMAE